MKQGIKIGNQADTIAAAAYTLWHSKEFQVLIAFDNLSQKEKDRVFNELQVTGLGLVHLYAQEYVKPELQKSTVERFLYILSKAGIESTFLDQWKTLMKLRFEEYKKYYEEMVSTIEESDTFEGEDKGVSLSWARVETMAILAVDHLTSGEVQTHVALLELVRKWLMVLDVQLSQFAEKTPLAAKRQLAN